MKQRPPNHDSREKPTRDRHRAFVERYTIHFTATRAAIEAGYMPKSATQVASRLLTYANVQKKIEETQSRKTLENRETADNNLRRLELTASYDVRKLFNEQGALKDVNELDPQTQLAIKGLDFVNLYEGEGEQKKCFGQLRKVRLVDRLAATIKLGEHFGTFKQRPELEVEIGGKFSNRSTEELRFRLRFHRWPEPGEPLDDGGGSGSTGGTGPPGDQHRMREGPPLLAAKLDENKG
jgi:phage terminase small subunit